MPKDPAFLFYQSDFIQGTTFMTLEERGAYITLLCYQADLWSLSLDQILKLIPAPIWEAICYKFTEENGKFYQARLRLEVEKRRLFTESRRKNLHMSKHMDNHMDAHMENRNRNRNENKDINKNNNVSEVIKDLNEVCHTNYRDKTPETSKMVKELLKRGFSLEDFKTVHRKKFQEWGGDPEWSKFLRPATLYQPKKFEGYLNQNNSKAPANMKNIKVSQEWLKKGQEATA